MYVSGKKLRDAFRQWRFRLDKKVKGKSLTGRGKITLSKVETAILDMQTRHSKRYNTTLVVKYFFKVLIAIMTMISILFG